MTEFGDEVKNLMSSLNSNGIGGKELRVLQKREKKKTEYTYTSKVSGIDAIITYSVNGKEKMKLVILLSQGMCFIQEKGQNIIVDESSLKSFLNGVSHNDCFPDGYFKVIDEKTGEIYEPMPKVYKNGGGDRGNRFTRCFMFMISNKKFQEHIKLGLLNFEIMYRWVDYQENRSWNYGEATYSLPWFFSANEGYYAHLYEIEKIYTPSERQTFNAETGEVNTIKDENYYPSILEDNIHLKMFRAGIQRMIDQGMSKLDALYTFYATRGRDTVNLPEGKAFTMSLFKCFLVLANRYDEPFATDCMLYYMSNPKLDNLNFDKLDKLLRVNARLYSTSAGNIHSSDNGYFSGYTIVPGSLVYQRLNKEKIDTTIHLDKNRLWDYVLFNSTKGLGDNLDDMFTNWLDYCTMCLSYYGKLQEKYPEHLKEEHDIIRTKYKEFKAFTKEEKLMMHGQVGQKFCDMKIGNYSLHIFSTVKEFLDEAAYMGNCLARSDYAGRVADGIHWIGSFKDVRDPEKSIFSVEINPATGQMTQIKARFNHLPAADGLVEETKVLKKMQDKIYKNMIDAEIIAGPQGYGYEFNFILKNE